METEMSSRLRDGELKEISTENKIHENKNRVNSDEK